MKKTLVAQILMLILITPAGCSKIIKENEIQEKQNKISVSYSDIKKYLSTVITKAGEKEVLSCEPIVDKDLDSLFYLINYSNGWEIISSDKRTPQVVAQSNTGNISLRDLNPSFLSWLNMSALDMKRIKKATDSELSFTKEEIESNIRKWDPNYKRNDTRGPVVGNWVLTGTDYYNGTLTEVNHILTTHWDQDAPYNAYCPNNPEGGYTWSGVRALPRA